MCHRMYSCPRLGWALALVFLGSSGARALDWVNAREGMTSLRAAAASASTYVLAGNSGEIWSSTDGVSWTKRTTPPGVTATVYGAVHGGGQFLLVGESTCCSDPDIGALLLTSPDGVAWTRVSTAPAGNNKTLRAVTFGNALYVAIGNQGAILSSADAASWTARASGTSQNLRGVSFGGGAFVAVGDNRTVLRSTDGVNWLPQAVPATTGTSYLAVAHTGSQFVAVGNQGAILTSADGVTWVDHSLPPPGPNQLDELLSVTSGPGVVVVGSALRVLSSPDGVVWTSRSLHWSGGEPNPQILALAYSAAGGFVATGGGVLNGGEEGGTLHHSADGLNWTKHGLPASRAITAAAWGNGTFCAVGLSGSVVSSTDGIVWTNRNGLLVAPDTNNQYAWHGVVLSSVSSRFVAVGSGPGGGAVMTSPDCITWTSRGPGGARGFWAVAEGAGVLVAVGAKLDVFAPMDIPTIAHSGDGGDTWTLHDPAGVKGTFDAVAFRPESAPGAGDARFVAIGGYSVTGANLLYTSPDGIVWTPQAPTGLSTYPYYSEMAYGNGVLVLVSGPGAYTSPDGVSWTARAGAWASAAVAYADGGFVVVGGNGSAQTFDGVSFVTFDPATRHAQGAIAYSPELDRLVATGDSVFTYAASEPPPTLAIDDVNKIEGSSGPPTNAVFTVKLSPASTHTVTARYDTANGTATSGSDYSSVSGFLTFAPGTTTQPIDVQVFADTAPEPNEVFSVVLSAPMNAALAKATGTGTIVDDDGGVASPDISIGDASVVEGNSDTRIMTLPVTLSAPTSATVSVPFATADVTATSGNDYDAASGTLVLSPGTTAASVNVIIRCDKILEGDETFLVSLGNPTGAIVQDGQAAGTISNDDAAGFSIDDVSVVEPGNGTVTASFTVTLSSPASVPTSVTYATADGTANAPSDYVAKSGTLSFGAGVTTQPVGIVVNGDGVNEGNETFTVDLSAPTGGPSLAGPQGTARVYDPGVLLSVGPCRLVDTRIQPDGPLAGPALAANATRSFTLGGQCGLPVNARAVAVNITVTGGTAPGDLRVFPAGGALPGSSVINYGAGQTRANSATIALNALGQMAVHCDQASGSAHLIVDVAGYYY